MNICKRDGTEDGFLLQKWAEKGLKSPLLFEI